MNPSLNARLVAALRPLGFVLLLAAAAALLVSTLIERVYEVPLAEHSFRFQRPLAGLLCLAAGLVFLARGPLRVKRSPRLLFSQAHELAALPRGLRAQLEPLLLAARVVAVLLLALALMGPQSIHARDVTEVQGIDIVVTMDLSLSMQAADIRPNRFVATQNVVDDFIQKRPNDRIGAVIFGKDAHTLLPLTTDHEALRSMISELQLEVIDGSRTAIGNGIGTALNRLRKSDAKSKIVILLTDGDSNSGNVSPRQAAEFAKTMGVKVYTILMGRSEQAPHQTGLDLFGRAILGSGNFPVNPELLKEVAKVTGGQAFQVSDREGLERSFHVILDKLRKTDIQDAGRVYGELFPAFVAPALLLLVLELLLASLVQRRWP
jgi:Ca-activated chloride channel family protein